jgi:hypothetical protein
MSRLVSYIVLTRDKPKALEECLISISEQRYPQQEIIVIDNGSGSDRLEAIVKRFPQARLVKLDNNVGVPAGRNLGIRVSQGEIIFFLDDDIELADPQLTKNIIDLFKDPTIGAVTVKVVNKSSGHLERRETPWRGHKDPQEPIECSYFLGGAVAIKRKIFDKCGLFPENFFFSGEELDLSFRMLEQGYRIIFLPTNPVYHKNKPGNPLATNYIYFYIRNRIWLALKYLPLRYAFIHIFSWTIFVFYIAFKSKKVVDFCRGLLAALLGFPQVIRERTPLSKSTVARINRLGGRTWY